jgi:hypothetical protein
MRNESHYSIQCEAASGSVRICCSQLDRIAIESPAATIADWRFSSDDDFRLSLTEFKLSSDFIQTNRHRHQSNIAFPALFTIVGNVMLTCRTWKQQWLADLDSRKDFSVFMTGGIYANDRL